MNEFEFFWRIERFIFPEPNGIIIFSPPFHVGRSTWHLRLDLEPERDGHYFAMYLQRAEGDGYPRPIDVEFTLSFLTVDFKSVKLSKSNKFSFDKGSARGWSKFVRYQEVLSHSGNNFYDFGNLFIQCKMKMCKKIASTSSSCFARTLFGMDYGTFVWDIKHFSALRPNEQKSTQITSPAGSVLSTSIFLTNASSYRMKILIIPAHRNITMSKCRIFVLDAAGIASELVEDTMFLDTNKMWDFPFSLTKEKLTEKKNLYLSKDVLTLKFEWAMNLGILTKTLNCATIESILKSLNFFLSMFCG
ncbi:speckle-type POZ protein [Trichonephila inaurata madagascariensis]|uniref:Speckle-type POZ protein n=1 Tax=Trichonephila inaurata madagascariensis TaxID=2747483 RepID=A0A8X7C6D4_9ARAC|nr:speckle-type POZ protein [Trichonephila inaurata madagascariensis]